MIWVFSTDSFSGTGTSRFLTPLLEFLMPWAGDELVRDVHAVLRKLAHVTEYAVLALLVFRALDAPDRTWARIGLWTFGLCVAYAATDELHQALVPSRVAATTDVFVDIVGVALGLVVVRWGLSWGRRSPS